MTPVPDYFVIRNLKYGEYLTQTQWNDPASGQSYSGFGQIWQAYAFASHIEAAKEIPNILVPFADAYFEIVPVFQHH